MYYRNNGDEYLVYDNNYIYLWFFNDNEYWCSCC